MKTLVYLACFASACALAPAQQNKTSTSTSSLPAADLAAIRSSNESYRRTVLEQAWPQWANLFTADAVMMPPNAAAVAGRSNIEAWSRAFPRVTQFQNPIAEIEGAGDSAVMRGSYTLTTAVPNQSEQKDAGKWICTLRKQDGAWKFHRCIFNSDLVVSSAAESGSGAPSIAGTYKLVSRKLPDGRVLHPPALNGVLSITPTMMNFSIRDESTPGKAAYGLFVSIYRLTATEFTETRTINTWIEGGKVMDGPFTDKRTVPVKVTGSRIEFTPPTAKTPHGDLTPPLHVFDRGSLRAIAKGEFEDTWEMVKGESAAANDADVVAAVKAAVEKHWAAINGNDSATIDRQHTVGLSMFFAEIEPRMRLNSPAWLGLLQRFQGAKTNWIPRDIEVQPLSATVATASFFMDGSVRWPDGTVDSRPRRVTEVWVNDNGAWKEAHHHDSILAANR